MMVFLHLEVKAEAGNRWPVHLAYPCQGFGGPLSVWVVEFCGVAVLLFCSAFCLNGFHPTPC